MLAIDRLTKTYASGHPALRGVTLKVGPGVFGLLGPNGAGKSTLMRTLATLQAPDSGAIEFDGVDWVAHPEKARENLGYLPQDFGLYPQATAQAMLDHFAVLKGVTHRGQRQELVDHLLARVNLWEVRHRRLHGFSGGMRQRMGLAQALIGNPRLLIVDEPTAGLDPAERHRILDLLAACGDTSVVLLSTHLVEDVADLCSRLAVMESGQIRMETTPSEAVEALRGRLWKAPSGGAGGEAGVLCTRRMAGVRTDFSLAPVSPGEAWEAAEPDLEHVFFSALSSPSALR